MMQDNNNLLTLDTREAPKNLGLDRDSDHSSSCESLAEPEMDVASIPPAASSTPSVNGGNKAPLPLHPRSAFISYVRRRGEPDGGRTDAIGGVGSGALDSSLANTTDSEHSLSDGYVTQPGFGLSNPRLGYASMRAPVRVSRPGGGSKPKIKLGSAQSSLAARVNKEHALFMDRLSVRTELSAPGSGNAMTSGSAARKPLALPEEEDVSNVVFNPSSLYFSQTDSDLLNEPKQEETPPPTKSSTKSLQDSMMRHMNRELTPSISEMYHDRNVGLGLAPPLSKLLLSPNYEEQEVVSITEACPQSGANLKTLVDAVSELELSGSSSGATMPTVVGGGANEVEGTSGTSAEATCPICGEPADVICRCKAVTIQKKSILKPWLSNVPDSSLVQASELTTADILERRLEIHTATSSELRSGAPYSVDLSRRDEGDGRSVADSQCSSNYKRVLASASGGALSLAGIGKGSEAEAQSASSGATCSSARLV